MTFELKILGSASATPVSGRHPTAQVLTVGTANYLIDCGEGTQRQMMRYGISFALSDIFFTHMHADHMLGLTGLLRTLGGNRYGVIAHCFCEPR